MDAKASAEEIGQLDLDEIARLLKTHKPDTSPSEKTPRQAAVAMMLREAPAGGAEALFIKRAEHPLDPWSGHMAFPGGRRDTETETLEQIAQRETLEEVGIELAPDMLIGRLHDLSGGRLRTHELSVSPFVFRVPRRIDIVPNYEVADVVWVPLEFMADPRNVEPYHHPADPQRRPFPSFTVGPGYPLWGMTYRMVCNFFSVFGVNLPLEGDLTNVE